MASKYPSTKRSAVRRRETANRVNAARAERSPEQQLAILDQRLGSGVGATKERARLQAEIEGKKK